VTGSAVAIGTSHAFVYTDAQLTDPGTLPGRPASEGLGINDAAQVVGSFGAHAFLHSNGQITDLNGREARAINDRGQIVANGGGRAFLLTPIATSVPEPTMVALFGIAAASFGAWIRWQRVRGRS
jgi:probable HAF family extracellular repeat protein